jgi:hypothetical protein
VGVERASILVVEYFKMLFLRHASLQICPEISNFPTQIMNKELPMNVDCTRK